MWTPPTLKSVSSEEFPALTWDSKRSAPPIVTNQGMLFPRGEFQRRIVQALHEVPEAGDIDFIFDSLQWRDTRENTPLRKLLGVPSRLKK